MTISIRRRRILALGGAMASVASLPSAVRAAAENRLAFLSGGTQADTAPFFAALMQGLAELGHREGENLVMDARYANYSGEQVAKLAAEIAAAKPAAIIASGSGISAAYAVPSDVPVIFMHSGNPVDAGFVESFARPGGKATGISLLALDLMGKRLELLKQIQPKMRRLAFLASPEHPGQQRELAAARAAAQALRFEVRYHEARTPAELQEALGRVAIERPEGVLLFSDALMIGQRRSLAEFFLKHRIPSAASWSAFPEAGHVLSYGPERIAAWRRLAYFADRILRGARPADLPVELPTEFELVVNRGSATAMGLVLPQEILSRADRVIDAPRT